MQVMSPAHTFPGPSRGVGRRSVPASVATYAEIRKSVNLAVRFRQR